MPQVARQPAYADGEGHAAEALPCQPQVADSESRRPYFMDIFCGTAGVTAAIRRLGADAMGFAHVIQKHRMKGPATKMDLTL